MEKETKNVWMCKGESRGWMYGVTENFKSDYSPDLWKNSTEISKKHNELENTKTTCAGYSECSICKERPIGDKQFSKWNTGQDIIEMELMGKRKTAASEWMSWGKNRWKWILRFL